MSRAIDAAKMAGEAIKREPGRERPPATRETTETQQRAAQNPGPIDMTGRPSTKGPGKSGL